MSEAIVKALDEAATRVGGALGKDAAKAVTDLYRDTGGKLTGVIERSVGTDVEHAGQLKQIADQIQHNAVRTDLNDTEKATANAALRDKLKGILDDPGKGGKPALKREDDDFNRPYNEFPGKKKGQTIQVGKSHLDANGNMEPANPNGATTITQHVMGGRNPKIKGSSPYTSFAEAGGHGKVYGPHEYQLDYNKLNSDIKSGNHADLNGVELHDPASVQNTIQGSLDDYVKSNAAHPMADSHVHIPPGSKPNGELTPDEKDSVTDQIAQQHGLSPAQRNEVARHINAMSNTRRDNEWLVKGTIPSRYLTKVR